MPVRHTFPHMHRRGFIRNAGATVAGLGAAGSVLAQAAPGGYQDELGAYAPPPGRGIPVAQQSVSKWCFDYLPLDELLPALSEIGLSAIDLIKPSEYQQVKDAGFTCSMAYGREDEDISSGFIDDDKHDSLYEAYAKTIPEVARLGWTNVVCFAGNRRGRFDLDGLRVAAKGLKRILPIAADHGVVLQMELFNSKVDHPDYMADSSAWGIALCDMVGSEQFKLLYDIYHMQVQEGNVIQTIRDYHPYFGHYHTAGVPGRHELNAEQELYYPAVARAIRETGFTGYLAHEFVPTYEDKLAGLREAVRVCS